MSAPASMGAVPRFLGRLYEQEAARRRALLVENDEDECGGEGATTPSATSSSSSSNASTSLCMPASSSRIPGHQLPLSSVADVVATPFNRQFAAAASAVQPPLRVGASGPGPASTSSTTSSEPALDFYPDSLDGFSSSESVISASSASTTSAVSRSASPSSRTAFMPSYYHSPSGHIGNWSPTLFTYLHHSSKEQHLHQLGALSLPPPSLDLPKSSSSTPPGENAKRNGKSTDKLSTAASESTTVFSPEFPGLGVQEDETSPVASTSTAAELELLQPPDNFAMVCPNVYRSSFPSKKHYPFLQSLGLKTVLTLVQDDYPKENADFFASQGINLVQIGIPGNKEPFVTIPDEKIRDALSIVLDKRNHPLFIHCNKGKVRLLVPANSVSQSDQMSRYSTARAVWSAVCAKCSAGRALRSLRNIESSASPSLERWINCSSSSSSLCVPLRSLEKRSF